MSEFKIPDEWREEFIKAYIPLVAGIDSVGVYEDKIEGLTTEEVYKVLYFCEVSTKKEWSEGISKFNKKHRNLALRYINCRGNIVPRLAVPFSIKYRKYRDFLSKLILYLSFLSLFLFFVSKYMWLNYIMYFLLTLSIIVSIVLYLKRIKNL